MKRPAGRAELKAWAREKLKGVQNLLLPSFSADLATLDEEGIRLDIERSIAHGFVSTHCATEAGLSFDEARRFVQIAVDAAQGRLLVSATSIFDTVERTVEFIGVLNQTGCDLVLIGYPPGYYPRSSDEVARVTEAMCDAAEIGVVLYPNFKYNFARLQRGPFPLDVLARAVRRPNVVGVLNAVIEPGFVSECFEACSEHALVQCPWERWFPLAVTKYGQQWAGPGAYELFQSPEQRHVVDYFAQLLRGEREAAMRTYWQLTPVRLTFEKQFMATQMLGTYHWSQQKYYQWLGGGNGGYTRQPTMRLLQHDMDEARDAMRAIGLEPDTNDEEFFVGRSQYAKGRRPW